MTFHRQLNGIVFFWLLLMSTPAWATSLTSAPFGNTADGVAVIGHTMASRVGVKVTFMNYGAAITDVMTPDRTSHAGHIVLGFPTLRDYETKGADGELYFGAVLGRYANWIAQGRFSLNGHVYQVSLSDPPNTIHGGERGSTSECGPCRRR